MKENKTDLIKKILHNPTYMPESGMYKNIAKALNKLSVADLSGLVVIVDIKVDHAHNYNQAITEFRDRK